VAQHLYDAGLARVYIHVPDVAHDAEARTASSALEKAGYHVPGIEHVTVAPERDEVRYFLDADATRATALAATLKTTLGREFHVNRIAGYEKSPNVKAARLFYKGRIEPESLGVAFRTTLEANGWKHLSSTTASGKGMTQVYEKSGSTLQVMIYESWYYTWVEMSATRMVGPASAQLKQ